MHPALALTLAAFLLLVLSVICYAVGERRGVAKGWLDCYFAQIAKDRLRRDKHGRFQKIGGGK